MKDLRHVLILSLSATFIVALLLGSIFPVGWPEIIGGIVVGIGEAALIWSLDWLWHARESKR